MVYSWLRLQKREVISAAYYYLRYLLVPFNHLLNFRKRRMARAHVPVLTSEQRAFWDENGFLVLKKFFSKKEIDDVNALVEKLWAERKNLHIAPTIDIYLETARSRRIKFADAPDDAKRFPYKLNDLYLHFDEIKNLVLSDRLHAILTDLLGDFPVICNSLNFERGSQQEKHIDSFYMTPLRRNMLVASWVSLEDCRPAAGPLFYYPGSHKIEPYKFSTGLTKVIGSEVNDCLSYLDTQIRVRGLKRETFNPKQGDVFLWHAQLIHGGAPIQNMHLTRKSLVTHYFRAIDHSPTSLREFRPNKFHLARKDQPV